MGIFVKCSDSSASGALDEFKGMIKTLAGASELKFSEFPDGCGIAIVNDKCDVGIQLKGIIDPEKEIVKLQKDIEKLMTSVGKLENDMGKPSYAKRPDNVKAKDSEKLENSKVEIRKMQEAVEKFKNMKL